MAFGRLCDDDLWEVDYTTMRKIEVFSKFGELIGTVTITEQLIVPDAIVMGDRCFLRNRRDDRYYEVFAVLATAIDEPSAT